MKQTRGSETSQYPEEEKSNEISSVAASERGIAQTDPNTNNFTVGANDYSPVQKELFVLGLGL